MNREKIAWLASLVLIAMLALELPRTFAHRDDDYGFVRTLIDIHRQVTSNYVDPVDEQKLQQGAIDGMLAQLDPFSIYVPAQKQDEFEGMLEGSFKGVGIQLNEAPDGGIEVVTPVDDSPAFKMGVEPSDRILKVNGEDIHGIRLADVIKKIAGPLGTQVTLTVQHVDGAVRDITMTRQEIIMPTVKGFQRNADKTWSYYVIKDPKIAYVRITQFTGETYGKLRPILENLLKDGMTGLILDLRFNPGGQLEQAKEIVNLFVREGVIVSTKGRNRPEEIARAKASMALPDFPMVVLVNEHSASASEIVAGSLMDNKRALVIGARTYGKGSVQEVIPLEGSNGELKLTVAYYYLPSGRLVHRRKDAKDWGVEPQVVVPMDEATERRIQLQQFQAEVFHRPLPKVTTRPATEPADATPVATAPTTQPTDVQLEAAVSTMIGHIIMTGQKHEEAAPAVAQPTAIPDTSPAAAPDKTPDAPPGTRPATEPATEPTSAP